MTWYIRPAGVDPLTPVEAQDPNDETVGTVSGELLDQSIEAMSDAGIVAGFNPTTSVSGFPLPSNPMDTRSGSTTWSTSLPLAMLRTV